MEIEYIYEDGDTSLLDGSWKRSGVIYCPSCRFSYDEEELARKCDKWYDTTEKLMQVIMQNYQCRRDGVLILSRCIDCGLISWVHRTFILMLQDARKFGIIDKDKIEDEMNRRKEFAKIEWDRSLCKTCKCLDHTNEQQYNYVYGVWVGCVQRYDKNKYSGIPKTKCEYYKGD